MTQLDTTESLAESVDAYFACRPDILADRHAFYRRLREEAPVYEYGPRFLVTRFADAERVLLDPATFSSSGMTNLEGGHAKEQISQLTTDGERQMYLEFIRFRGQWMSEVDAPEHSRRRDLAHRAFTPRVVRSFEERVQTLVDELIEPHASSGSMEIIKDLSGPLPLAIICESLDLPREDWSRLRAWADDLVGLTNPNFRADLPKTHGSMVELKTYLGRIFAERRAHPEDTTTLMGGLLAAETAEGSRFTEDELTSVIAHLVFAGHETTMTFIGNIVVALMQHRDQWELLVEDPDRVPMAFEELMRYCTPSHEVHRTVMQECELAGTAIARWRTVTVNLAAANRDQERYENPDDLDITRPNIKHVGFGLGPHFCLGASLNRLEVGSALKALVQRFPDLELACRVDELAWLPNRGIMGPLAVPVRFGRDRG